MAGLLKNWQTGFRRFHPDIVFSDFLKGSASATYGFAENVAELGLSGRQIYTYENYGVYRRSLMLPVEIEVATGSFNVPHKSFALAVLVHRDNPLARLTLAQLDGIFSDARTGGWQGMIWEKSAARGPEKNLRTWGQLGLTGEWADKPIRLYGPPGLHAGGIGFFQSRVMGGSDIWAEGLMEFEDRAAMVSALAQDRYGIAYTGLNYATQAVKPVALAEKAGGPFVALTRETVASRAYPLSRAVYIYFAPDTPGGEPANPKADPKIREFLRYILSCEGQADVAREGDYLPLTAAVAREQFKKLD
jgi:phosphate transport system substrate-binding protein